VRVAEALRGARDHGDRVKSPSP